MNGFGFAARRLLDVERHDGRDEEDEQQRADELRDVGGGSPFLHARRVRRRAADSPPFGAAGRLWPAAAARRATASPAGDRARLHAQRGPRGRSTPRRGLARHGVPDRPARPTRSSCWPAAAPTLAVRRHPRPRPGARARRGLRRRRRARAAPAGGGDRPARASARPRDLEGQRVGVTGLPSDDAVLRAVVEDDGGDYSRVQAHHDRLLGGAEPDRRPRGRRGRVLERRGRGAAPARRAHARVPRRRLRRAALPGAGARDEGDDAARAPRATSRRRSPTCADGVRAWRCATAPRTIAQIAKASGADEALVRAQLDAVAPALRAAGAARPRRAGGMGALRRALRDPRAPARRGPGASRSQP